MSFLVQCATHVPITINVVVNLAVGVCLYILLVFVERYLHIREIVVERYTTQQRTINDKDKLVVQKEQTVRQLKDKLQQALTSTLGGYSQAQLARLVRLHTQGNELFRQHISFNNAHPQEELDAWLAKHDKWREDVLSILNDFDKAVFERPITAGSQTIGHQQALNRLHGDRRGQILEEMSRIAAVVQRNNE